MNKINIENIEVFKGIKKETIEALEECAKVSYYKKGEYLFFNKDRVEDIYFIVEGKITLFKYTQKCQKRVIYILGEGEFINEVIFDNLPSSINAEAFEKSVVIRYSMEEFRQIMATDFDLALKIINSLGRKVRRLYRQIKNTVPISLDKKVAAKLWKLSKDYGTEATLPVEEGTENWTEIDLKITITYIADMLGSSREGISREMKKIEGQNLIKWDKKKILVKKKGLSDYFKK